MGQQLLSEPKKTLKIVTEDEESEVTVLDGRLHLVATGRGKFETKLPPGAYKVVAQLADARHEELVILDAETKSIYIPPLAFASPVPLHTTARVRADVIRATIVGRDREPIKIGERAQASLFLVITESADLEDKQKDPRRLGRDTFLLGADGKELFSIADVKPREGDVPCLTATFRLVAGIYRLRVKHPSGDSLEQAIVTLEGWQTQVFLRRRQFQTSSGPEGLRPDLANAAIAMFKEEEGGFDPASKERRLSELARLSLSGRHPARRDKTLLRIVRGQTRDLMLALYDLHSLLANNAVEPRKRVLAVDEELRRQGGKDLVSYITTLRKKLDPQVHPDVEALVLLIEGQPVHPDAFRLPPMLRQSWVLICEATAKYPEIASRGTVSSQIALGVVNQQPWLQWMSPGRDADKRMIARAESYREVLEDILPKVESEKIPRYMREGKGDPGPFPDAMGHVSAEFSALYFSRFVTLEQRERLIQSLGVPSSSVETLLRDLILRAQKNSTPRYYAARFSLEAERVLGEDPFVVLEPARDGEVHLPPRQKFGVRFRSRKAGVVTVAILGPEGGIILPRNSQQFAVQANEEKVYPSLQAPNKEKARLLITVTAKPLADQLRKEIADLNVYLDEAKLNERVDRAVRATDQEWSIISTVTLVPEQKKRK